MAGLTSSTIAGSYERLLILPAGGLNGTNLVAITDGDSDTASVLQIATTSALISGSGSKLLFSDNGGEYISGDGTTLTITAGGASSVKLDANSRVSLSNNDSGTSNTIFGKSAGASLDAGSNYNVFIGENVSDAAMNDAVNNIGVGYQALSALTQGDYNVAVGANAMVSLLTGQENVAIGQSALEAATTEAYNIAIGSGAMSTVRNDGSDSNVAIGREAFTGGTGAAVGNIVIGADAMNSTAGNAQTGTIAIGHQALTALTSGAQNIAIGYQAGDKVVGGTANILIGYLCGDEITSGSYNTAIGDNALSNEDTGHQSTAVGVEALGRQASDASEDADNTAVGMTAGKFNILGQDNTAVGSRAMRGVVDNNHSSNTAVGKDAMFAVTTGSTNTCIGERAGDSITSGAQNVFIGSGAGTNDVNFATGDKNVVIGHNADASGADVDNEIVIGQDCSGLGSNRAVIGNDDIEHVYMAHDGDAVVYCGGINMSNNQPPPASGSSSGETLDGYEEGTWTAGNGNTTVDSVTNTTGYYTKIGNKVFFHWYSGAITFSSSSGGATITGLPFTSTSASHAYGLFTFEHGTGVDGSTTGGYVEIGNTFMYFLDRSSTSAATYINSGGNFYIMVSGNYTIA